MKSHLCLAVTLGAAALIACSDDPAGPDGDDGELFDGLELGATVVHIAGGGSIPPGTILAVEVSLRNTTSATIEKSIPAGCAVRARLYLGNDNPVYDQTVLPCNVSTTIPLIVAPGETKHLSSGTHFPFAIEADSVPAAIYRATAVLRITGENPIELDAGTYRLPHCSTPDTCAFVGPPADK